MTSTMGLVIDYAEAEANERYFFFNRGVPEEFQEAAKNKDIIRAALEQRIKELERDAKRYRWLRDETADREVGVYTDAWNDHKRIWLSGEEMDKSIDRAMSEAALQKAVEISQEYKLP